MPQSAARLPFNWKRVLLKALGADAVALGIFLVGKLTNHATIAQVGFNVLATLLLMTIGVLLAGPVLARYQATKEPPATQP